MNRSRVTEKSHFWLYIIFRGQHFSNRLGEAIYPQIAIYILICYEDICYS